MRRALAVAALFLACSRQEPAPASASAPVEVPIAVPAPAPAPNPDDAPLPAEDEVPAFLSGRKAPPAELPTDIPITQELVEPTNLDSLVAEPREPTLRELMRSVQVDGGGGGSDDSWAFIANPDAPRAAPETPEPEVRKPPAVELRDGDSEVVIELSDEAGEPAKDPCAALRTALEKRQDFLRRTAAERDTFGYVADASDSNALRMFQSMRRCEANPDDPDCKAPPLEADVSELEIASHQIERAPSDLDAEGKQPDDIPHDAVVLDLLHQLKRCQRRQVAQPLLDRGAADLSAAD